MRSSMLAKFLTAAILLPCLQTVSSTPQAPEPSSQPQCDYICPPLDKAGWRPVPLLDPSPTEMFCSYPTVIGENPLDFYCIYSKIDSHLVYDHNADLCQDNAVCVTFTGRRSLRNAGRRNTLPKRRPRLSQSNPASDVRPSVMKTRVTLGKEKKRATKTI
ncbi:hypothetical protein D9611_007121 [Ephemerocybe angulata]|uniref:Uncharacterized protein n=1 Tax=Ephemerocybe angulata TaxID=980116 RepID=A0A8H5B139_9AGAR|nr:hypothetical protein D9611_007121 [Tulosesus angulatus]